MGELMIVCPETGKYVRVGISLDAASFKTIRLEGNRVRCPHCGADHIWGSNEARFLERLEGEGEPKEKT